MPISYEVPRMELIVQDQDMACWFASAMMLVRWREFTVPNGVCRALDDDTIQLHKANKGIQNSQILPLAKRLGLVPIPPMSPTPQAVQSWLLNYGPLWTNGARHIVVIAGIRGNDLNGYELKVYDPWPGNGISWRSMTNWYAGMGPTSHGASTRDTGTDVQAVFLHLPASAFSQLSLTP